MIYQFWTDETAAIISLELVIVAAVLVIGLIVGLTVMQSAIVSELSGMAQAIGRIDQSYRIPAVVGRNGAWTAGSWNQDIVPPMQQGVEPAACTVVCGGLP